jgi:hypothetical protein
MSRIVVDIETVGFPLESFDEQQQTYLLKFAEDEHQREEAIQKISLYPLTAQIIVIGMLNPETNRGKILFQSDESEGFSSADELVQFVPGTEREMIEEFWRDILHYKQIVTFNGRGFDAPFLHLRSAAFGILPTKNLMPYRYEATQHCDLLEQFTFHGAIRKFNLDFYCKAFGIDSPKSHGVTGLDLKQMFEEKKYREIAEYNLADLKATAELYRRWEPTLKLHV